MKWLIKSKGKLSRDKLLLDVLAEFFEGDGFSVESSNCVNNFPELFIIVSVSELLVDVSKLVNGEFSSSLKVIQAEVSSSSFFAEWVTLK